MSRSKFWYVNCDACGEEAGGGEGSYGAACPDLTSYLKKMRADGWTFGKRDLCMECNGNGPKRRAQPQKGVE